MNLFYAAVCSRSFSRAVRAMEWIRYLKFFKIASFPADVRCIPSCAKNIFFWVQSIVRMFWFVMKWHWRSSTGVSGELPLTIQPIVSAWRCLTCSHSSSLFVVKGSENTTFDSFRLSLANRANSASLDVISFTSVFLRCHLSKDECIQSLVAFSPMSL